MAGHGFVKFTRLPAGSFLLPEGVESLFFQKVRFLRGFLQILEALNLDRVRGCFAGDGVGRGDQSQKDEKKKERKGEKKKRTPAFCTRSVW